MTAAGKADRSAAPDNLTLALSLLYLPVPAMMSFWPAGEIEPVMCVTPGDPWVVSWTETRPCAVKVCPPPKSVR